MPTHNFKDFNALQEHIHVNVDERSIRYAVLYTFLDRNNLVKSGIRKLNEAARITNPDKLNSIIEETKVIFSRDARTLFYVEEMELLRSKIEALDNNIFSLTSENGNIALIKTRLKLLDDHVNGIQLNFDDKDEKSLVSKINIIQSCMRYLSLKRISIFIGKNISNFIISVTAAFFSIILLALLSDYIEEKYGKTGIKIDFTDKEDSAHKPVQPTENLP